MNEINKGNDFPRNANLRDHNHSMKHAMEPIKIQKIIEGPMLITRARARKLQPSLDVVASEDARISLDFDGIAGMAPSFFDELLRAIDEISEPSQEQPTLIIHNPPTQASSKFQAVARSHSRMIQVNEDGDWLLAIDKNH